MAQEIDITGLKKNFNTTVVGDSVTVITQYAVRTVYNRQYYPQSRVYEFNNRPVDAVNYLTFETPLIVVRPTARLPLFGTNTNNAILGLNQSVQRAGTSTQVNSANTASLFVKGSYPISVPINSLSGGVGTVNTFTDVPGQPNIYGVALTNTATWAFAIEQLPSSQTSGLTVNSIITVNTSSGSTGNFGTGNTAYVQQINSGNIIVIATSGTTAPVNGTIDGITPTGQTFYVAPSPPLVATYLIVGGGGGGGSDMGGGGGAGGYIAGSGLTLAAGTYPITVGAGGPGAPAGTSGPPGTNGNPTIALGFTALGGGGGASKHDSSSYPAGSGGSGGGGSGGRQSSGSYGGSPGTGTAGQGNNGAGSGVTWYPGGGGGAGAAASQTGSEISHGGVGISNSILGSAYFWAGGGGGAGYSNFGGNGGNGGGGGGAPRGGSTGLGGTGFNSGANATVGTTVAQTNVPGGNAGANTGGGGGGGAHYNSNNKGGDGGSGIVVVRYPGAQRATGGTVTTVSGDTVHAFTATGISALVVSSGAALPTFRDPVPTSWLFTITNLASTIGYNIGDIISSVSRTGRLGAENSLIYLTRINTASNAISGISFGNTSPLLGNVNAVYSTGESLANTVVSNVSTSSPYTFVVGGLKSTSGLIAGSPGSVITATNSGGSFGAGNTVIVSAILGYTSLLAYVTSGTSVPVAGIVTNFTATGATVTLPVQGQVAYTTTGTYSWTAPTGVTSVSVVAVGGGGGGGYTWSSGGGGGGGLGWKNSISVTPGQSYTVVVGQGGPSTSNATNAGAAGGTSYFISTATVAGYGGGQGGPNSTAFGGGYGGGYLGDSGGRGGNGAFNGSWNYGGAGAGGYSGNGASSDGGTGGVSAPTGSGGGAAGGYYSSTYGVPAGGGVGIFGRGADGTASGQFLGGGGGSGGQQGRGGESSGQSGAGIINGGAFGGGGGGSGTSYGGGWGGRGAVRIIWGTGRSFPTTLTADQGDTVTLPTTTVSSKNDRIGGSSFVYPSSRIESIPLVLTQNNVPRILPVVISDPRRVVLQRQVISKTGSEFSLRNSITFVNINVATTSRYFSTGTLSFIMPLTTNPGGVGFIGTVTQIPMNPNIYGVAVANGTSWAFAIENLSSTQTSSLVVGRVVTDNTSANSTGNFGTGNTTWVYSIGVGFVVLIATGGATPPVNGTIDRITITGQTYIPPILTTVDLLLVGGGGSGGNHSTTNGNGGGGAGGLLYGSAISLSLGSHEIVIGQGGNAVANVTAGNGNKGTSSTFGTTFIAHGGGGGGSTGVAFNATVNNGGSGGGKAESQSGPGLATQISYGGATGYGNQGGANSQGWTGAGGGGAGTAGVGGSGGVAPAGDGGQGRAYDISGTMQWYAGGGGGGGNSSERAGDGYAGGGRGAGTTLQYAYNSYPAQSVNAITTGSSTPNAIPNTGGGGGGGSYWAPNGGWGSGSGAGGSGIAIVRYLGGKTSLGGTITSANGYTIHTFTANGTFVFNGTSGLIIPSFRAPIQSPWTFAITGTSVTGFTTGSIISSIPRTGTFGSNNEVYVTSVDTSTNSINCFAWAKGTFSAPPASGVINAIYPTGEFTNINPIVSGITSAGASAWIFTISNIRGTLLYTTGTIFTATSITGSIGTGSTVAVSSIDSFTQIKAYAVGGTTPVAGSIGNPVLSQSIYSLPPVGDVAYVSTGTYSWTAPSGVTSVSVVAVGGGGGGGSTWSSGGGGGGGLGWKNNIAVTPGQSYTVVVGSGGPSNANATTAGSEGGNSYFISLSTVAGYGGGRGGPSSTAASNGYGGGFFGDGGGRGGDGAFDGSWTRAGAGAGGYTGRGAEGIASGGVSAPDGGGGAAGGHYSSTNGVPAGGGVGIYGQGASGVARGQFLGGGGGSGGENGRGGEASGESGFRIINGGAFGGGGGGSGTSYGGGWGGRGAVRIIWGVGRAFPATNAGTLTSVVSAGTTVFITQDDNIGGDSNAREVLMSISSPPLPRQNTAPTQVLVNVNSSIRSTIKNLVHVPTNLTNSSDYESAPSVTTVINSGTTGTYIYRSSAISATSWIFRIYNISSATVSSLTTSTIITANTSSGQTGRFDVGSTVTVYSIVSATSIIAVAYGGSGAPTLGPIDSISAPGGTYIPTATNYTAHIFTTVGNSTFTPAFSGPVEYLVVGGGGGGADTGAGGGGGYRSSVVGESSGGGAAAESMLTVTAGTPYTVTVGAGGAGRTNNSSTPGENGGNSVFGSITALGGGGGGAGFANGSASNGAVGGSGGGGSTYATTNIQRLGGAGTAGQGYAGGNSETNNWTGGGGGGAGGVGGNASGNNSPNSPNTAGNGGIGARSSISGSATYYAGGGGGGGGNIATGLGGLGGGGNGEAYGSRAPVSGTPNTGGGGGGGWENATQGSGGSGIVIVRYTGAQNATGGNTIVSYTGSLSNAPVNQYQVVFNGTSQYLTTPSTANYNLSTGDWTVECWVYVTSNGNNVILTSGTGGSSTWNYWQINSDRSLSWQTNPAGNWNWVNNYVSAAGVITLNTWTHIAAVRYGSNFSMYVNGVSVYSTNSFSGAGQSGTLFIGTYYANYNNDGSYFRGNISNFRIVKGTAVYTSAFATPTSSLTAITNTVLLICRSATFVDLSTNTVTITPVNSPTISAGTLVLTELTSGASSIPTPLEDRYLGRQAVSVAVVPVSSATSYFKNRSFTARLQSPSSLPNNLGIIRNISPSPVSGSSATIYNTTQLTPTVWAFGIYNLTTATVTSLTYGAIITIGSNQGNTGTGNTIYFYTATNNTSIVAVATDGSVSPANGYITGITVTGGTYTPTSSPAAPTSMEYFVVGGGGGAVVGGGGAGGVTTGTSAVTAEYRYNVLAGGGGASGQQGFGSAFEQVNVLGGGFGGASNRGVGVPGNGGGGGASGGGGGSPGSTTYQFQQSGAGGGGGTAGQGNSGGSGGWWAGSNTSGGGGGGFTGAGASGSGVDQNGAGYGGAGGSGTTSTFSGSSVTYAQGGGGWGAYASGTPSGAGAPGTGNGGGAYNAGGTGIVMIRYPSSDAPAWSVTGNPTVNVTGGYRIYSWVNTTTNATIAGTIQFAGPSGYIVPNLGVPGAPGPWTFSVTDMNTTAEFRVGSVVAATPITGSFGSNNTVRVLSITSGTAMVCLARSGDVAPSLGTVAYIQPTGAIDNGPVISNVALASAGTWSFIVSNLTSTIMMQPGSIIFATTASGSLASFGTGTTAFVNSIVNISQITAIAMGGTSPVAGVINNVSTSGAVVVVNTGTFQTLTFIANPANLAITNNGTTDVTIFKNASNNSWDTEARVAQAFTAPCTLEFFKQAGAGDNNASYAMMGWNEDPLTNASYTSLDYAAYPYQYNLYFVHNAGTDINAGIPWDPTKKLYVVYTTDGYIKHYNHSTLLYSVFYGIGKTVYVDSTFYSANGTFGGFSNIRVKDVAWSGGIGYNGGGGTANYSIIRNAPDTGRQDNWDNIVANVMVNTLNRPANYFGNETTEPTTVVITNSTGSLRNIVTPTFDLGFNTGRIVNLTTVSSGAWTFNIDRMTSTREFTTGSIITAWSGQGSFGSDSNVVTVEVINSSTSLLCKATGLVSPSTGTIFAVAPSGAVIIPPQITAVNPYSTDYSVITADQNTYRTSFNGSSDYYTLSSNAFAFGANNFTAEAWIWLNALPTSDAWPTNFSSHMVIAIVGTPSAADGFGFLIGQTKLIIHNNDAQYASPSVHGLTTSTWNHVAYVRSSDTFNFYVNGVSKGSVAFSGSVGSGSSGYLGCETGQGAFFNGRISNLRMVNGVAVYTGTFAPGGVLGRTQSAGTNIAAVTGNQTTLLAFAAPNDIDSSNNNYTLTKVNTPTIAVTTLTGSTATIGTINGWSFTLSNLPTTSTALLSNGSVILANTGVSSSGNFGTNNTVYVNTITNGTQVSCLALGGSTAPNIGSIDSISTSGAIVTTTNILFSSAVSGGSFTVTNNSTVITSDKSSVLFPITQTSGGVYFEFTPITGSGTGWYVGVQRAPSRVGAYEAGVGATGNLGTGTVFYPTNGSISSAFINLGTTSTVSWNGSAAVVIPGTGQLYFGVYSSSPAVSGSGTINWGTSSFATVIQPVPLADVSTTGTSLGVVTYSVTGGALPVGAYLNSSSGIIYWYRQNLLATSTTTNITVTASAAGSSETVTKTFSLVISAGPGGATLYAFTNATFTSGGVQGRSGPSLAQARAGMSGTGITVWRDNTSFFNTSNGIQLWTVPVTGSYRITATGAGAWNYRQGGYGATLAGTVSLNAGEIIQILVGQVPTAGGEGSNGGAAGGTFVTRTPHNTNESILLIAGGGGGGHNGGDQGNARGNSTGTAGRVASSGGAGGTNGGGGTGQDGGGGGGFFTNGVGSGFPGFAYVNGGYGSNEGGVQDGGFGGGASSGNSHGAGGGGYSGGGGSGPSPHHGGGGGSYFANATNIASQSDTGSAAAGSVVITLL